MTKKSNTEAATISTGGKKVSVKKSDANPQAATSTAQVARDRAAAGKKSSGMAFSLDDIEALVANRESVQQTTDTRESVKKNTESARKQLPAEEEVVEKRVLGAASLSDILGFDPSAKQSATSIEETEVPAKWKKYYGLLIDLREHLMAEIDLHTSDTLQHHADDHSGDRKLEDDSGTDAFDRDFALSLVSSEQDALNEIEEALLRIRQGSYGVCEVTGELIGEDRLTAVPFTRYSVEGQAEFEKNARRKSDRGSGGLFSDGMDDTKMVSDDDDS